MSKPVLFGIEVLTPLPNLTQVSCSPDFWRLETLYYAKFHTTDGVWYLKLLPGWITDKRSGSDVINWLVPKDGNPEYRAAVFAHDTAYSGWMSKLLADRLFIKQGMHLSGEVSQPVADLAYTAVKLFGKSYGLDDPLPAPYELNRKYESLILKDR